MLACYRVDYRGGAAVFGGDFLAVDVVVESFHTPTLTAQRQISKRPARAVNYSQKSSRQTAVIDCKINLLDFDYCVKTTQSF